MEEGGRSEGQNFQQLKKVQRLEEEDKVYAYIVRHNYVLGGMIFTICKLFLMGCLILVKIL